MSSFPGDHPEVNLEVALALQILRRCDVTRKPNNTFKVELHPSVFDFNSTKQWLERKTTSWSNNPNRHLSEIDNTTRKLQESLGIVDPEKDPDPKAGNVYVKKPKEEFIALVKSSFKTHGAENVVADGRLNVYYITPEEGSPLQGQLNTIADRQAEKAKEAAAGK